MRRILSFGLAVCALFTLVVLPVAANAAGTHPYRNQVNRRVARQHTRISNGLKNKQLNIRQASRLRAHDAAIKAREERDLAHHNGHLTAAQHKNLNHQLNSNSGKIYRAKH